MKKSGSAKTVSSNAKKPSLSSPKEHAGSELAGTVWRIAVPVAGFVAAGAVADDYFGSSPWLALVGVVIGFVLASLLVKHQAGYREVIKAQHRLEESKK
jgi:F0F1-type ATP synthase assembly protein I